MKADSRQMLRAVQREMRRQNVTARIPGLGPDYAPEIFKLAFPEAGSCSLLN